VESHVKLASWILGGLILAYILFRILLRRRK
jgi:hypothetical protein